MKNRKFINKPITNSKEAIKYLTKLAFSELQYHLDEDAEDIVWENLNITKEECVLLDQRNIECRKALHNDIFDLYYPLCMESSELKIN